MKQKSDGDDSCLASMIPRDHLQATGFFDTEIGKTLKANPISIVDVGARWGINEMFAPIANIAAVVAFEPDSDEAKLVLEKEQQNELWASVQVFPTALGNTNQDVILHLLKRPNNSSIYPVDPFCSARYALDGFQEEAIISVPSRRLDDVIADEIKIINGAAGGEIIKLDTQGAEYDIIMGGQKVLQENTVCLVCEVPFFSPYIGAKSFSEIERKVFDFGLKFYGFVDFKYRSTKRLNKQQAIGRERLIQADAVFFRDPDYHEGGLNQAPTRQVQIAFVSAFLLGYFDYCLEILEKWNIDEKDKIILRKSVISAAHLEKNHASYFLEELQRLTISHPERALVHLGKFVDDRRDRFSYHDVY